MTTLTGLPISPGVARGVAAVFGPSRALPAAAPAADGRNPREHFTSACRAAEDELRRLLETIAAADGTAREIVAAHLRLLADPMIVHGVEAGIDEGLHPSAALERTASALVVRFEAFSDPRLRARSADVRDVCSCIARHLARDVSAADAAPLAEPRVVFAVDLSPLEVVQLALRRPLAFVLERGTETSHASILMRALAIPAIIQVANAMGLVRDGDLVVVEGERGEVILRPDHVARAGVSAAPADALQSDPEPALTREGIAVAVTASIGDADEARRAVSAGADGIGLFRTEWLFVTGESVPSEDTQAGAYQEVARVLGHRCLTVRTFDLGGDKQARGVEIPHEPNPALGLRGVRLSFARPDLLQTQLRALLRASGAGTMRLLVPMVTDIADVARMRSAIAQAAGDIGGMPGGLPVELGVMVETPAAALMADELAEAVDFLSIGTNDLTQYVLAADRENAGVAAAYQPLHPAVLRLVRQTIAAAARRGKPVGICGETAGNALAVPLFIGMGAVELTVVPAAVPRIKRLVRALSVDTARALADEVTALPTAAAVLERLQSLAHAHAGSHVLETRTAG